MNFLDIGAFLIIFSFSSASEILGNDADTLDYLLSHLRSTEEVVQQLLGRVEQLTSENKAQQQVILNQLKRIETLERRDYDQRQLNVDFHRQLATQQQRTSSLERLCERMKSTVIPDVNKDKGNKKNSAKLKHAQNKDIYKTEMENTPADQVFSVGGKLNLSFSLVLFKLLGRFNISKYYEIM